MGGEVSAEARVARAVSRRAAHPITLQQTLMQLSRPLLLQGRRQARSGYDRAASARQSWIRLLRVATQRNETRQKVALRVQVPQSPVPRCKFWGAQKAAPARPHTISYQFISCRVPCSAGSRASHRRRSSGSRDNRRTPRRRPCRAADLGGLAAMGDSQEARHLLSHTKLAALLRPQHVVTIKDSASVDQTLRVRNRHSRRGVAAPPSPGVLARCHRLLFTLTCLHNLPLSPSTRDRCWPPTASCQRPWSPATAATAAAAPPRPPPTPPLRSAASSTSGTCCPPSSRVGGCAAWDPPRRRLLAVPAGMDGGLTGPVLRCAPAYLPPSPSPLHPPQPALRLPPPSHHPRLPCRHTAVIPRLPPPLLPTEQRWT